MRLSFTSSAPHAPILDENQCDLNNSTEKSPSWEKRFPRISKLQQRWRKSRRIISLDSSEKYSTHLTKKLTNDFDASITSAAIEALEEYHNRAYSTCTPTSESKLLMHPLKCESVEVFETPLSSLRSCSEFMKQNSYHGKSHDCKDDKKPSFFKRIVSRLKRRKHKDMIEIDSLSIDERLYLIEQLRYKNDTFNEYYDNFDCSKGRQSPINDLTGSTLNVSSEKLSNDVEIRDSAQRISMSSIEINHASDAHFENAHHISDTISINSIHNPAFDYQLPQRRSFPYRYRKKQEKGLFHETSVVYDLLFGYKTQSRRVDSSENTDSQETYHRRLFHQQRRVMEIELKELRHGSFVHDNNSDIDETRMTGDIHEEDDLLILHDRLSLLSQVSDMGARLSFHSVHSDLSSHTMSSFIAVTDRCVWYLGKYCVPITKSILQSSAIYVRKYLIPNRQVDNAQFYDAIRIQPFSSGAYLRAMLLAGFSSFFFHGYNLALWSSCSMSPNISFLKRIIECLIYFILCIQFILNMLQFPLRLRIHYDCWESSRAMEAEQAISILRNMINSDYWVVHRGFGKVLDVVSITTLIFSEMFLWIGYIWNSQQTNISHNSDSIRLLLISISATTLLEFIIRILVALSFSISVNDPQALVDARKRGLTKYDLEALPSFVFKHIDDVNNCDCPICLSTFELGEHVIPLSCDSKHAFHSNCIRQWLERQNSCPLCQKLV